MNFIRMDPVLAAMDTDGDGIISAEEIRNSAAAFGNWIKMATAK